MNQKGIAFIPIIVWTIVILGSIFIVQDAIKKSYIPINLPLPSSSTPEPSVNPLDLVNPVKQFYSYLSSKKLDMAWNLLSKNFQTYAQGRDHFIKGYANTQSVEVQDVHIQDSAANTVFVKFQSVDNINGQIQTKTFSGTWKLAQEDGQWKLDTANIVQLNQNQTQESNINSIPFQSTNTRISQGQPTACLIGASSYLLNTASCQALQKFISDQKQKDSDNVKQIITNLNGQIQKLSDTLDGYTKGLNPDEIKKNCDNASSTPTPSPCPTHNGQPNPSPYTMEFYQQSSDDILCQTQLPPNPNLITQCMQTMGDSISSQIQAVKSQLDPLNDQRNWYQNYLNGIQSGSGNGACSGHNGVSCILGKGDIGQVTCQDGWRGSQVYYFNVKECVDYIVSQLPASK